MSAESVLAILGIIASVGLALSPLPTMSKIIATRSIGDYSVLPYSVTCAQAILWVAYSLEYGKGKETLIRVNAPVALIELVYVLVFFRFVAAANVKRLLIETVTPMIAMAVGLIASFVQGNHADTIKAVGILAMIFNIAVYASPLMVLLTVIRTRSVEYMPLLLSVSGTVCAVIWLTWAWLADDMYVLIPSCIGAGLGVIQLGIYAYYRDTTRIANAPPIATEEGTISRVASCGASPLSTILSESGLNMSCKTRM